MGWKREPWKGKGYVAVKRDENGRIVAWMPWSDYIKVCKEIRRNRKKLKRKFQELSLKFGMEYAKETIIGSIVAALGISPVFGVAISVLFDELVF